MTIRITNRLRHKTSAKAPLKFFKNNDLIQDTTTKLTLQYTVSHHTC